jgi:Zn-finger nucleic acid-binding protein/RNA polymerase subunit RPABC4/transcription elongation factor Spt4
MIVECPRCALRYDVANQAGADRPRCRCGALLPLPRPGSLPATLSCPRCAAPVSPADSNCSHCGGTLIGRLCPHCFAVAPDDAKYCPACGAEIQLAARATARATARAAARTSEEQSVRSCPRCRQPLAGARAGEHPYEHCPGCGGLWVDRQIFDRLLTQTERQRPAVSSGIPTQSEPARKTAPKGGPQPFYLNCPECGQVMARANFATRSGVLIDRCPAHGIWFDRDELSRILAFVRDGGKERAEALERERRTREDAAERQTRIPFEAGSLAGLDGATLGKVLEALARKFGGRPR